MSTKTLKLVPLLIICLALTACDGVNPADLLNTTGATPNAGADDTAVTLSGTINPGQAAKQRPRAQETTYPYTIVAQSDATGAIFRQETESDGSFALGIPAGEEGSSFVVTVLAPDGRAVGPVVLGTSDDDGVTGLKMQRDASLGTIDLPADTSAAPIQPGDDSNVDDLLDTDLAVRVDQTGVPVGLASFGKGDAADTDQPGDGRHADRDGDGLIDMFDADDDGDGTVDDFDDDSDDDATGEESDGIGVNFFMNLKISSEQAHTYYSGTTSEINARLATDTVITFETFNETTTSATITAAQMLETPGPAYLPTATTFSNDVWADLSYALVDAGDRFEQFVIPNDLMNAGDTFTLEVTFDDGTTTQYTRMINYVFKNIPTLLQYGVIGSLTNFDVDDATVSGTAAKPIPFDGTQDLTVVYTPPVDETGAVVTGMFYTFQVFYNAADDGSQLNNDIDTSATWPTGLTGMDNAGHYRVELADLPALSASDTYTVTLPKELFPDTVTLTDSTTETVGAYKVDITAESTSGNAGIMLVFEKQ